MQRPRRNDLLIPLLGVLADTLAIFGAFWVAYTLRFHGIVADLVPVTKGTPPASTYLLGAAVVAPIWLLIFNGQGVYRARRAVDWSLEFFTVGRGVGIGMLVVLSLAFFYRSDSYSRVVFGLIYVLSVLLVFAARALVVRYERHLYRRGRELRPVLLVGANTVAQKLALSIAQHPEHGFRLVGYLENGEGRIESVAAARLGRVDELHRVIAAHRIETVIVCLAAGEHALLADIQSQLEGRSVQLLLQPEVIGVTPSRLRVLEMLGSTLLGVKDYPMTSWNRVAKRAFDIVFSLLVLAAFSPFAALIALLIRLESGRPIFYRQVRIGLEGEEFDLLKFRTMRNDAERETGPTWTKRGDPRVTRIGRILRRLSIDEIPQFLNVLRGEMSVVGPRPERPEFVDQFRSYVPKYLERHRLKTGLTGWAQVNGLRGEVPIAQRTKYDIYYIENWSMMLDLRIIFKTLYAVLFGKDAY